LYSKLTLNNLYFMFFIKTLLQSLNMTKRLSNITTLNVSIILKYLLNELKVLKFAVETTFVKKKAGEAQPLLEFFKRNCFFRDYIYL